MTIPPKGKQSGRMMKKLILWGAALLIVINATFLITRAYHRWWDDGPRRDRSERRMSITDRLELTTAQEERITTMRRELDDRMEPYRGAYRSKRNQLYDLLMDSSAAPDEILQLKAQLDSLRTERESLVFEFIVAHKEVLDPEQQTRFFRLIKERYRDDRDGYRRR